MVYRGRFAPSPTGALHLGSAAAAIFARAAATKRGGKLILRIEDIDSPRLVLGAESALVEDLRWLGVAFDEGPGMPSGPFAPYRQSERSRFYDQALEKLERGGHLYLCDCSRSEIARIASAPHLGEEGPLYPGTCRAFGMARRPLKRPPAIRLWMPEGETVCFEDGVRGRVEERIEPSSDFVLKRGDGVFSYQLACTVDDLAMEVSEAVRAVDLASSAIKQAYIARLLGAPSPIFTHLPLLVRADGSRLAKRDRSVPIRDQRALGRDPADLVREIAAWYGFPLAASGDPWAELGERFDPRLFSSDNVAVPAAFFDLRATEIP